MTYDHEKEPVVIVDEPNLPKRLEPFRRMSKDELGAAVMALATLQHCVHDDGGIMQESSVLQLLWGKLDELIDAAPAAPQSESTSIIRQWSVGLQDELEDEDAVVDVMRSVVDELDHVKPPFRLLLANHSARVVDLTEDEAKRLAKTAAIIDMTEEEAIRHAVRSMLPDREFESSCRCYVADCHLEVAYECSCRMCVRRHWRFDTCAYHRPSVSWVHEIMLGVPARFNPMQKGGRRER